MSLIANLSDILTVTDLLKKEIEHISIKKTFKKGEQILEISGRCDKLYFIESGLIRGYYFVEDKEITNWFAQEHEFATCFYSFIANKPAFENIQAIEDCVLIELSFSSLQNLYKTFPETERLGRIITENYYIKLEERILSLQFKN